jgi:type II secretory pathway pseudopilin PulG
MKESPDSNRPRARGGFTIIELVVVVFMLLIIVLTIMYSVERSLRTSNELYRMTTATFLAQRKMEEVMTRASCYTTGGQCPLNLAKAPPLQFYYDFKESFCSHPPGYCAASYGALAACNADCACEWVAGACTNYDRACEFPAPFEQFKCRVYYLDASSGSGGGIVIPADFIKEIQVRVWFDENYNNICDSNEADVLYQTALTYRSPAWNF